MAEFCEDGSPAVKRYTLALKIGEPFNDRHSGELQNESWRTRIKV
jgi:hypothetical protein